MAWLVGGLQSSGASRGGAGAGLPPVESERSVGKPARASLAPPSMRPSLSLSPSLSLTLSLSLPPSPPLPLTPSPSPQVTDDVSIVEALGRPVRITPGAYTNLKARGVWPGC